MNWDIERSRLFQLQKESNSEIEVENWISPITSNQSTITTLLSCLHNHATRLLRSDFPFHYKLTNPLWSA